MGEKVGFSTGTAIMENSMAITQKVKNRTTIWFISSTTGYITEGNELLSQKDSCTSMLIAALFTTGKIRKQKCLSLYEWTKKMWYKYTME